MAVEVDRADGHAERCASEAMLDELERRGALPLTLGTYKGYDDGAYIGRLVKGLLEDLVERRIKPGVRRLFIIDGSNALRAGIDAAYGTERPVQRCRIHKIRNVQGHLPENRARYATMALRAAFKMEDRPLEPGRSAGTINHDPEPFPSRVILPGGDIP